MKPLRSFNKHRSTAPDFAQVGKSGIKVCVHACVRACVRAGVLACMCVCVPGSVRACMRSCVLARVCVYARAYVLRKESRHSLVRMRVSEGTRRWWEKKKLRGYIDSRDLVSPNLLSN